MCNLSEAIAEERMEIGIKRGREKGRAEGRAQEREQLIANFLRNDNHVSHAVNLLSVPERLVLSVARKEKIEVIQ